MSKTDQQIMDENIDTTGFKPTLKVSIFNAMQAAREDERQRIREIMEKRIKQLEALNRIDGDRDEQLEECNYLLTHLKEVSNQ